MATSEQQLAQVMQQVALMQDRLTNLEQQLGASQQANGRLQQQLQTLTNAGANNGPREARGGLFDKKLYEPQVLEDARDFKEWSDDFYDWCEMCDNDIPRLLLAATRKKDQIAAPGGSADVVAKAKPLFRMMKRFITLKTARQTVSSRTNQ